MKKNMMKKIPRVLLASMMIFNTYVMNPVRALESTADKPMQYALATDEYVIQEVTLDKNHQQLKPGDTYTMTVKLLGELQEEEQLLFSMISNINGFGNSFHYDKLTNTFTITGEIGEHTPTGKYLLECFYIVGDLTSIYVDAPANNDVWVEVVNEEYGKNQPYITSITGLKETYKSKETLNMTVNVESLHPIDDSAFAIFMNEDNKRMEVDLNKKADGKGYEGSLVIPMDTEGEWVLNFLTFYATDDSTIYTVNNNAFNLNDVKFKVLSEEESIPPTTPEEKPEETPDVKPEETPDVKPEEKPEEGEKPAIPETPVEQEKLSEKDIEKALQKIENATNGQIVKVDMKETTVAPQEVLESAKGKNVNVVLDMGGYTWTINGQDIKDAKDINLEVKMGQDKIPHDILSETAKDNPFEQLSLSYNGEFGFKATFEMKVNNKYVGQSANLYYFNPKTNKMEYMDNCTVNKDGYITLDFSHASEYALVFTKNTTQEKPDKDKPVNTADTSSVFVYSAVVSMAAAGIYVTMKRKETEVE